MKLRRRNVLAAALLCGVAVFAQAPAAHRTAPAATGYYTQSAPPDLYEIIQHPPPLKAASAWGSMPPSRIDGVPESLFRAKLEPVMTLREPIPALL